MCRVHRSLTVTYPTSQLPKTHYSFVIMPRSSRKNLLRNKRICIVCAERVTQMTKTYNDIEAVTRLLEEKERDLELAARIGQSLLEKNNDLELRNAQLEEQYTESSDKVQQLTHELSIKDSLLQGYLQDEDEDEDETPETAIDGGHLPFGVGVVHIDNLQKKMRQLEVENVQLLADTDRLKSAATEIESLEVSLQNDCMKELHEKTIEVQVLSDELCLKQDVNIRQQEELTEYITRQFSLEGQVKRVTVEKVDLQKHLQAAQQSQRELTTEVAELNGKYEECLGLMRELQDDNKMLAKQKKPAFIRQHNSLNSPFLPEGSLALELEDSIRKEGDFPVGYSPEERRDHTKRVMDTAACVRAHRHSSHSSSGSRASVPRSRQESVESIAGSSHRGSVSDNISVGSDAYQADTDSVYGSTMGRPGIPGSNDLETALKRLTLRKANEINEYVLREHDKRRQANGPRGDGSETPTPCQTPGSYISTGSQDSLSDISRLSNGTNFRHPEKLQIVKPLEGSYTLNHWKKLATPDVQGFFEDRPGIQTKGERPLDLGVDEEVYSLSDYEEDGTLDDPENQPGPAPALHRDARMRAWLDQCEQVVPTSGDESVSEEDKFLTGAGVGMGMGMGMRHSASAASLPLLDAVRGMGVRRGLGNMAASARSIRSLAYDRGSELANLPEFPERPMPPLVLGDDPVKSNEQNYCSIM